MSWLDKLKQVVNPALRQGKNAQKASMPNAVKNNGSGKAGDKAQKRELGKENVTTHDITSNDAATPIRTRGMKAKMTRQETMLKRQAVARLTPREREVFARFLEGAKMKEIAGELQIKTSTVNGYCRDMYRKLGVNSKAQLILQYSKFRST